MCYNQTGDISTLDGTSLKLVDKFTFLGSSVSSTEKDIDTRLTKAWTATDRLSIIWKSDLTDKMKRSFFQAAVVSILLYGCTTWTLTKRLKKTIQVRQTRHAGHCWRSKDEHISDVLLWTPAYGQAKAGRPARIYSSYVRIRDVALKTCRRRWMIRRSGERGSGISWWWWWHSNTWNHLNVLKEIKSNNSLKNKVNDQLFI